MRATIIHEPDGTIVAAAVDADEGGPRPVAEADNTLIELDFPAHLQDRPLNEVFTTHRVEPERGVLVEIDQPTD